MICGVSTATAAITHVYNPGVSETLAEGVPAGCLGKPPAPACLSGALTGASAIATSDSGLGLEKDVWVADQVGGKGRVDKFDAESGAFVGPQLDEEPVAGATALGGALAVGHAFSGEQVYAKSGGNLAVFNGETGKLLGVWNGAHTPVTGFGSENGVAVDGSAGVDKGDVYVVSDHGQNNAANAVDVFDPEELGLTPGEEPVKPVELIGTCPNKVGNGEVCEPEEQKEHPFVFPRNVAVSPLNGDVYVADIVEDSTSGERSFVDVFEPAGGGTYKFLSTITEANGAQFGAAGGIEGLAVDGEGDLYIALGDGSSNTHDHIVYQFNPAGTLVSQLEGPPTEAFSDVKSIAADAESGHVFVGDSGTSTPVKAFGQSVTIPDVKAEPATEVHATHVQLNGTVKLDEAGNAQCVFEYGTSTSYGSEVPCEPVEVEEKVKGEENPVKATISEFPRGSHKALQPDTTYFYRVRAVNGTTVPSEEDHEQVTTAGPGLDGESASEVASTAVTLGASIDPHGSNTSYYFQYGESSTEGCVATATSSSCATLPAVPGEALGSTLGEQNVSQRLQGLAPGHVYHYRVVVISEPKAGETVEVFPEADKTFTTQPAGGVSGVAGLPDGRAWELVSPPDKHGALIQGINVGGLSGAHVIESSPSGDALTYVGSNPTEEGAAGYYTEEQVLSTRGASGWSSQDISLPRSVPNGPGNSNEYHFFSEDLSLGLAEPVDFTALKPDVFPPDSEDTPYVRHDLTCQTTPSTCFQPLVTGAPGYADVPEDTEFGSHGNAEEGVEFEGASPDLSHVVVRSVTAPLKSGAALDALYEWAAGAPLGEEELEPVSVLPASEGGGIVGGELGETAGGFRNANAPGSVSADGSRVFWQAGGRQYLRDMTHGHSLVGGKEIPGETLAVPGGGDFQVASSDGSRVFYVQNGDLVVCEVGEEPSGALVCDSHDLTPGGGVVGRVLGASEDGSYVYFVSNSVLGDGGAHGASAGNCKEKAGGAEPAATVGESCNVYVAHYDGAARVWEAPVFIAALSGNDGADWRPAVDEQTARVSPDGRWLTFMSDRSLTGYDNHDAHSGKPDEEVFLYHAPESLEVESGSHPPALICASCNPTGARPDGTETGNQPRLAITAWSPAAWLAANIPGWTEFKVFRARYQSRFLSDDGRLFFNSSDALVPQAINNNEDVYEWEPAGVGSCSSSAPGFNSGTGGCVGLISSGTSAKESAFLDASANGNDVFFLTAEPLVKKDTDTAYDVYDAHVCGAEGVPCAPESVSPPECTTAEACRTAGSPQPEVFGAPAGETFNGPGNLAPSSPAQVETKAQKLTKALRTCRKDRSKKKRRSCETAAKKKYAAPKKAKKTSHNGRTSR
jgi:hypothetical protein